MRVAPLFAARRMARVVARAVKAATPMLMLALLTAHPIVSAQATPSAADAFTDADPRVTQTWLRRIHEAADKRSYQGTVVVSAGGVVESSRLVHVADGRQRIERVDALDGVPRHVVRQNEQVSTVWPQRRLVTVEPRSLVPSFPALLHGDGDAAADYYALKLGSLERVAGREAQVMQLRARDSLRYGYRLWADKATALLLRMDVLGERGEVLESAAFPEITVSEVSAGQRSSVDLLQPLRRLDGFRVLNAAAVPVALQDAGWSLKPPVAGFKIISCTQIRQGDAASALRGDAAHLQAVYSDGLTHVTVFIEPFQPERHSRAGLASIGATQTLMRRYAAWWVTWMGDVPPPTLRAFSEALVRLP